MINKIRIPAYYIISLIFILLCLNINTVKGQSQNFEMSKNLDIYVSLLNELNLNYADEIYPGELIKNSIDGMLDELDPYTVYITESEIEDLKFLTTGEYGGIGALIMQRKDGVYISEIYKNTPSSKSGLRIGDKIIKINGKDVSNNISEEISDAMKGQPGTKVVLSVKRPDSKSTTDIELIREVIKLDNVFFYGITENNIGYIKLDRFAHNAAKEVKDALDKMKQEGTINGLILDLRGNPGGLLNEAVDVCNLFINAGKLIVSTKGKQSESNRAYYTTQKPVSPDLPLAILVDEQSASASEIVAGAVQDLDRGVVIGEKTFGKGLVQNILPLPYNAQVKMTIAKYFIPSGRCIQKIDYFKHDKDGNKINDSTALIFKTANGRMVKGSGGITPDILCSPNEINEFISYIVSQFYIFDFAAKYINENTMPDFKNFVITNDIFQSFVKYLKDSNLQFKPEAEEIYDDFVEVVKNNDNYNKLVPYIDQLRSELNIPLDKYIQDNENDIKDLIYITILDFAYNQNDSMTVLFKKDKCISKCIEILSDKISYRNIINNGK